MIAPERRRWSLNMVKWWAGWSQNEKNETVRYFLEDVLDREEAQLGNPLTPDIIDHAREMYLEAAAIRELRTQSEQQITPDPLGDDGAVKTALKKPIRELMREEGSGTSNDASAGE